MSKYLSMRKGEVRDIDNTLAETLIAAGVAEQYNLIEPTGKITITKNGNDIDVAQYAKADVNVSGGLETCTVILTITNTHNYEVTSKLNVIATQDSVIGNFVLTADGADDSVTINLNGFPASNPATIPVAVKNQFLRTGIGSGFDYVSGSGDVTYSGGMCLITGDCSITLDLRQGDFS